jgi:hypothetical protein
MFVVDDSVVVHGQHQLPEAIAALDTASGRAGLLNGWQQEADEYGNNGDDDQQFNECKTASVTGAITHATDPAVRL